MTYLFDTGTLVLMMRGAKIMRAKTSSQFRQATQDAEILTKCREASKLGHRLGLSAITVAELEFGACKSDDYETEISFTRHALRAFEMFDFTVADCCERHGRIRHRLAKAGKLIGANDLLIAAHALALDATIVTNNTREFGPEPGLRVESWAKAQT